MIRWRKRPSFCSTESSRPRTHPRLPFRAPASRRFLLSPTAARSCQKDSSSCAPARTQSNTKIAAVMAHKGHNERLEQLLLVTSSLSTSLSPDWPVIHNIQHPKLLGDRTRACVRRQIMSFFSAAAILEERIERLHHVGAQSSTSCGGSDTGRAQSARGRHRANRTTDALGRLGRTAARAQPREGRRERDLGLRAPKSFECEATVLAFVSRHLERRK